jgi:LmbE family N-acetylglucosaminyl deacetylase
VTSRRSVDAPPDHERSAGRRYTLVSFHAHPDDETALTGGTLAKAAAQGHRVILVVATLGEAGLTGDRDLDTDGLAARRLAELHEAAAALGCARVEWLGYADSGFEARSARADRFTAVPVDIAAARLAELLGAEHADVLTTYDPAGGYGHPDHVRVHHVGARAAELAGTPVVLEATVDRRALLRLARVLRFVPGLPPGFRPERLRDAFSPTAQITHRIDVREQLDAKRAAMAAHVSQTTGGTTRRALAVFLRLPQPIFGWIFGHEWYVARGVTPNRHRLDDVFATLQTCAS